MFDRMVRFLLDIGSLLVSDLCFDVRTCCVYELCSIYTEMWNPF